jgi:predicted O-linked N-acetylglucosamine transferase (SPINDLY family)
VGLPELVTSCLADYEALAARLASEPAELEEIRQKLRANQLSAPLFDCRKFTRQLEAAFEAIWSR